MRTLTFQKTDNSTQKTLKTERKFFISAMKKLEGTQEGESNTFRELENGKKENLETQKEMKDKNDEEN